MAKRNNKLIGKIYSIRSHNNKTKINIIIKKLIGKLNSIPSHHNKIKIIIMNKK
mgnify:CR=1 FL=1